MRELLRKTVLKWVAFFVNEFPYLPVMGKLRLFQSARTTHRCLTGLASVTNSAVSVAESKSQPPMRSRVPSKIWFLADLFWEPKELLPELQKICDVAVTDLNPATKVAASREKAMELVDRVQRDIRPDVILLYAREGLLSSPLFDLLRTK